MSYSNNNLVWSDYHITVLHLTNCNTLLKMWVDVSFMDRLDYCNECYLHVYLGPLSSSYSLCWILWLVWFLSWNDLITLHLPWSDGFALASVPTAHYIQILYDYVKNALLGSAPCLSSWLWHSYFFGGMVDGLSDPPLMFRPLLFLVITRTSVWDLLLWLAPVVGMFCLLVWGLPVLV